MGRTMKGYITRYDMNCSISGGVVPGRVIQGPLDHLQAFQYRAVAYGSLVADAEVLTVRTLKMGAWKTILSFWDGFT